MLAIGILPDSLGDRDEFELKQGEDEVMNTFDKVADLAAELIEDGNASEPRDAWEQAVNKICAHSESMRKKSCPRSAFNHLCYEGLVKGVPKGSGNPPTSDNYNYAVKAVEYLIEHRPSTPPSPSELWRIIIAGKTTAHNGQMDVVLALWNKGFIIWKK